MADTTPRRRRVYFPFFRDYCSVSLLAGGLFGFALIVNGTESPTPLEVCLAIIGAPAVLLVPGVVKRSPQRILLGLIPGFLVVLFLWVLLSFAQLASGRVGVAGDQLLIQWIPTMAMLEAPRPYFSAMGYTWLLGCVFLLVFLLPMDIVMLYLRAGRFQGTVRSVVAIAVSSLPIYLMMPLASFGQHSNPNGAVGFSNGSLAYLISIVAFWLIFPAKYALLNLLYEPQVFLAPYGVLPAEEG